MKCLLLAITVLASACGGSNDQFYAKERALPSECRGRSVTLEQAQAIAGRLLPTVPVVFEVVDNETSHNTRRDRVTGVTKVTLVRSASNTMAVAHELAHAAVFDAYKNTASPGQPSTEKSVPMHGEEFLKAYRLFMAQLVSPACAGLL